MFSERVRLNVMDADAEFWADCCKSQSSIEIIRANSDHSWKFADGIYLRTRIAANFTNWREFHGSVPPFATVCGECRHDCLSSVADHPPRQRLAIS